MDGRDFFRLAVKDVYEKPYTSRSGPRISAKAAAKADRQKREALKKTKEAGLPGLEAENKSTIPAEQEMQQAYPVRFIDHFILNLPATAIDFLDAFQGIYNGLAGETDETKAHLKAQLLEHTRQRDGSSAQSAKLPMVHCYCFTKELEAFEADICKVGPTTFRTAQ